MIHTARTPLQCFDHIEPWLQTIDYIVCDWLKVLVKNRLTGHLKNGQRNSRPVDPTDVAIKPPGTVLGYEA